MLDDLFSASIGLLAYSKEKAEEFIEILVDKGEMHRDEAQKLVNRLVEKGKAETERCREQVQGRIKDMINEKIITKEDFKRLENKLDQLITLLTEKQ
ncbi:MAG: polyhydroxyalkanoate synthesis regulator [Bacillota bacterium]